MFILTYVVNILIIPRTKYILGPRFYWLSNESDDLLNDTHTSSPSPQVEMPMGWVGHFSAVSPWE